LTKPNLQWHSPFAPESAPVPRREPDSSEYTHALAVLGNGGAGRLRAAILELVGASTIGDDEEALAVCDSYIAELERFAAQHVTELTHGESVERINVRRDLPIARRNREAQVAARAERLRFARPVRSTGRRAVQRPMLLGLIEELRRGEYSYAAIAGLLRCAPKWPAPPCREVDFQNRDEAGIARDLSTWWKRFERSQKRERSQHTAILRRDEHVSAGRNPLVRGHACA
jgi:hypothetical protein